MLNAAQLTAARAAATAALDLSGILVQRATRTPDTYGTYSESWATVASVAGSWAKPSASVMTQYAGLIGSLAAWTVRLPHGTSLRNGDRLVMPPSVGGDTLTVQADLSESSYSTCVRVLATEVR
jgi:ABC-type Fe3+-siderophore transport system permease subunit